MSTLLFYFQDPGGTNFLLPTIKYIKNRVFGNIEIKVICHPLSKFLLSDQFIESDYIIPDKFPITESDWESLLQVNNISYMVTTLSSNKLDLSNSNLINVAKKINIPTLGFMDHWKGFDRLFNDRSEPIYCPDWLGVIDESCADELRNIKITSYIKSVGHPFLESLINNKVSTLKNNRVLFVSQPEVSKNSFNSLFLTKFKQSNLLKILECIVRNILPDSQVYYRPHPKETLNMDINSSITIDNSSKPELFSNFDTFIGFNSMLLLEARVSGAKSISIRFPELNYVYDDEISGSFGINVNNLAEFEDTLNGKITDTKFSINSFENSSENCLNLIQSFLSYNKND